MDKGGNIETWRERRKVDRKREIGEGRRGGGVMDNGENQKK